VFDGETHHVDPSRLDKASKSASSVGEESIQAEGTQEPAQADRGPYRDPVDLDDAIMEAPSKKSSPRLHLVKANGNLTKTSNKWRDGSTR
jgi:hypothetical protein